MSTARQVLGVHKILAMATLLLLSQPIPSEGFKIAEHCLTNPIALGINGIDPTLAKSARFGWIRITLAWRDVNPAPNVWNYGGYDGLINDARSKGLQVLAILSTAPQWAGSNANGTTPPSNTALWRDFVWTTAQRYAGKVAAYEIWNEPNLENAGVGVGWNKLMGHFPRYVDYLQIAAIEIRAAAPGTLIVAPATSSSPNSRTVDLFKQIQNTNSSSYIDVVSFHANGGGKSLSEVHSGITSHISTIRTRNHSNASKPFWITEFGWNSGVVGESQQHSRTVNVVLYLKGEDALFYLTCNQGWASVNFTHAFIYTLVDGASNEGVFRSNLTPKQIVSSYLLNFPFPAIDRPIGSGAFTVSCAGRNCTFSAADFGTLERQYRWDFGDTSPVITTSSRTVSHAFPSSGRYFVKQVAKTGGFETLFGAWGPHDMQLVLVP